MTNKIIIIILVILLLCYIISINKETFNSEGSINTSSSIVGNGTNNRELSSTTSSSSLDEKNRVLFNIFLLLDGGYLGTFIPENQKNDKINLITTLSLLSYEWHNEMNNAMLPDDMIIFDLCYNIDKRLLAIGIKYDVQTEKTIYKLYRKKNIDINSEWEELASNEEVMCVLFDIDDHLLGIRTDGQILKKKTKNLESDWNRPINFDLPMRKIMYDKDGKLLGIGLDNNYIYKKDDFRWDKSKWNNKYLSKTEVYDIIHDYDGCLIATTNTGLKKQEYPHYMSNFVDYYETNSENKILSLPKIIYFRTGVTVKEEVIDDVEIDDPLIYNNLNKYIIFKDKLNKMCDKKIPNNSEDFELSTISQMDKINEIEHLIKTLQK